MSNTDQTERGDRKGVYICRYMQHDVAIKGVEINEEKSPLGILQKEVSPKKCYKMEAHKPISIKLDYTHGIHIDLNASKRKASKSYKIFK